MSYSDDSKKMEEKISTYSKFQMYFEHYLRKYEEEVIDD